VCHVAESDVESVVTAFAILGKGFITVAYSSIYVVTAETYPTSIRAAALGLGAAVARAGSMASSFVGGILVRYAWSYRERDTLDPGQFRVQTQKKWIRRHFELKVRDTSDPSVNRTTC